MEHYDLAIIGGGINGCGIARDAAGRGLSVLLVEQGDLGSATSSASTKLVHGGLRYLEHFNFSLVRQSLRERARLLRLAPHLVRPVRFVMPQVAGGRSAWKLRAGFALYDWFAGDQTLPKSRVLDLADDPAGVPLKSGFRLGFEYSDCVTDDARLVIANAIGAREKGAVIRPRTRCIAGRRDADRWRLVLKADGGTETVTARALVNAAGSSVLRVLETVLGCPTRTRVRFVRGSHIVVPRLHAHDRAYLLPNRDGRIVFAVPFAGHFTLIGTTEVEVTGVPDEPVASADEILYLCSAAGGFFRSPVTPSTVKWTFAGLRTLVDDGRGGQASRMARDHRLELDGRYGEPPLVTIFGGKLTTYRQLAEQVLEMIGNRFILRPVWTDREPLPGGDLGPGGLDGLIATLRAEYPFLRDAHVRRLAFAYGTRARLVLEGAKSLDDLGPCLAGDLHAAELDYLKCEEWAATADDVLWRRSKLGLEASTAEIKTLRNAMDPGAAEEKLAG